MSLIIDIETVPDDREVPQEYAEKYLPVLKIAKNIKDEEKKKVATFEWEENFTKKQGLDPAFGRIVCIGMIDFDEKNKKIVNEKIYLDKDEKKILSNFWEYIKVNNVYFRTITFNGLEFDLPFIYTRSIYQGVRMTITPELRKYTYSPHFDLMQALNFWKFGGYKSLAFWLWYFGINDIQKGDSSKIYEYWQNQQFAEIAGHCMNDCRGVLKLYQRIKTFFPSK